MDYMSEHLKKVGLTPVRMDINFDFLFAALAFAVLSEEERVRYVSCARRIDVPDGAARHILIGSYAFPWCLL